MMAYTLKAGTTFRSLSPGSFFCPTHFTAENADVSYCPEQSRTSHPKTHPIFHSSQGTRGYFLLNTLIWLLPQRPLHLLPPPVWNAVLPDCTLASCKAQLGCHLPQALPKITPPPSQVSTSIPCFNIFHHVWELLTYIYSSVCHPTSI